MNIVIFKYAIDKKNVHCIIQGGAQTNAFKEFVFEEIVDVFNHIEHFYSKDLSGGNDQ